MAEGGGTGWRNLGAGTSFVGCMIQGMGSYMQHGQQAANLKFNARQSLIDAQITEQNADEAARRLRLAGRKLQGQQRVMVAKSGFRLEGTPLEAMVESMKNRELDASRTREEGRRQAQQHRIQAKWQRKMAKHHKRAGTIGLISGSLSGTAGAASMFAT